MSSPRVWFVTGSSTGFVRAMTEHVLRNGEIAIATLRKPEVLADLSAQYPSDKLFVLKLDVSQPKEVAAAFSEAEKKFGRIDVVFNNAAYAVLGELESTPEDVVRTMFDVNFWGAGNVSKEAVRVFREVNRPAGGRLLQVSSVAGFTPIPAMGFYAASKYVIARNLKRLQVTIIEPGAFRTSGKSNLVCLPQHPAYGKPTLKATLTRKHVDSGVPGGDVAAAIVKITKMTALPEPPLHFPLGKDSIQVVRSTMSGIAAEFDQYESWSEDLPIE